MEPYVSPHVRIFDTTLRDGEQAPGCTMNLEEKLEVARQLARLRVDIIEAGFPAASPGDWAAVHEIAREVGTPDGPVIAALARANKDDIDKAWGAIQPAAKKRIHTFISSSDIHIEHQFRSTREEVLNRAREMVRYARSLCDDVEFSPMDATRSDPQYMYQMLAAVVAEGATTLNIPDTVGYTTPEEYAALIAGIYRYVPGMEGVTVSTHCHDDLGMAVANSLAGVRAGARQIECTINGIGERAGNASLEEVVMALHTRQQFFNVGTQINTRELAKSSKLLSTIIGMPVPPNKAIVGANAFAHESGIHQDGVLKNRMTYEIMDATVIGLDGNELVLGKHSGRNAFRTKLAAMGYEFDNEEEFQQVFVRFKELCDKKKTVDDRDIQVLVAGGSLHTPEVYKLEHVQVTCGTGVTPVATVRLQDPDGVVHTTAAHGTGPVDSIYKAVDKVVGRPVELLEFSIKAVTEGIDAVAEVSVRIREPGAPDTENAEFRVGRHRGQVIYSGYSANTDTIVAAAEAYMGALNKLLAARQERLSAENAAYAAGYDRSRPTYAVDLFGNNAVGTTEPYRKRMTTIAYLGPPGSYSEIAALAYGGSNTSYLPMASMPAAVTATETGAADVCVLPIENVLEGSVTTTLDLLIHETELRIAGEMLVPIQHYLVARPSITLDQVKVLYAHPQSLGQCRKFVERCLPGVATVASLSNSAAPAEALADERPAAAIATLRAATLTGAQVIAQGIQDRTGNVTRFVALGRQDVPPSGDDKTSFCFGYREDRAGVLVESLAVLAEAGINMTKLESRPSKEVFGQYIFLVDINGHRQEPRIAQALDGIRAQTGLFKVFGSYPRWKAEG